jgi:hypothetical protein
MRRLLTLGCLTAVTAAACVPLPLGHEVSSRRVSSKGEGNTFYADDGAWCRVPEATYARVRAGDDHTCVWKRAAGRSSGGGRGIPGRPSAR